MNAISLSIYTCVCVCVFALFYIISITIFFLKKIISVIVIYDIYITGLHITHQPYKLYIKKYTIKNASERLYHEK